MGSSRRVVFRTEGRYTSTESLPLRLATYFFVLTKPCLATGLILTIVGYTTDLGSVSSFEVLGPLLIALSVCFFLFCGTFISPQYRKWFSDTFRHKAREKHFQQNSTMKVTDSSRKTTDDPRVIIVAQSSSGSPIFHSKSRVEPLSVEVDFGNTRIVPYPKPEELYKFNELPIAVAKKVEKE